MRLPRKVRVGGKEYTVCVRDRIEHRGKECWGLAEHTKQRIQVMRGLGPDVQQEVLMHEVLHCVDEQMDTGLRESQVKRLALGLLQVFRDNNIFPRRKARGKRKGRKK